MPEFGSNVTPWAGGFRAASPGASTASYTAAANAAESEFFANVGSAVGQGLGAAIQKGMESYDNKQTIKEGEAATQKFQGTNTTNVEAAEAVAGYTQATANREGLTEAQLKDLDENALKQFGTDMRKLTALRDAKKIGPKEANAQAMNLFQSALANPRVARFTEKYKALAAPLLGTTPTQAAAGEGAGPYFGLNQEEKQKAALAEGAIKDAVKYESDLHNLEANFGFTRGQAVGFMQQRAKRELQVKQAQEAATMAESDLAMQRQKSYYSFQANVSKLRMSSDDMSMGIASVAAQNNGVIPEDSLPAIKTAIDNNFQKVMDGAKGLSPADYSTFRAQADDERKRFLAMVEDKSALKALERGVQYVNKKREEITGKGAYELTTAVPDVAAAFALGPEYGKFYVDARGGGLSSGFEASKDPWKKAIADTFKGMDMNKLSTSAMNKISSGDGKLTTPEAQTFSLQLTTPGAAQAITKTIDTNPATLEAVRTVFATEGTTLSTFNTSMEWKAAMKSEQGRKAVAEALKGATEQARAMQIRKGLPTRGITVERDTRLDEQSGIESIIGYNIKSTGIQLDPHVSNNLGQAVMILDQNPEICKMLGVANADEWLSKVFDVGTNQMASPRITKPESLPTKDHQK